VHERWLPTKIILKSGQLRPASSISRLTTGFFGKPEAKEMIAEMQDMIGCA
jgi:hypothetical protein